MTLLWPKKALPIERCSFNLAHRNLRGPSSISGITQTVSSDAAIWHASLGPVFLDRVERRRLWSALGVIMEGGLVPILVPIYSLDRPLPPEAEGLGLYDPVPYGDGSLFSDGTGYVNRVIDVVCAEDAARRAVRMKVTVNYAAAIEPGMHFSVGERLYRIRTFDPDTGEMTFRPTLREAVAAGTDLEFDQPVCRMKLLQDGGMDMEETATVSMPTVTFIEAI